MELFVEKYVYSLATQGITIICTRFAIFTHGILSFESLLFNLYVINFGGIQTPNQFKRPWAVEPTNTLTYPNWGRSVAHLSCTVSLVYPEVSQSYESAARLVRYSYLVAFVILEKGNKD